MLYLCFYFSVQSILEVCFFHYLAFYNLLFWEITFSSRLARSFEGSKNCFPWIILDLLLEREIGSWMNYMVDIFGKFNFSKFSDFHSKFYCEQDLKRTFLFTSFFLSYPGFDQWSCCHVLSTVEQHFNKFDILNGFPKMMSNNTSFILGKQSCTTCLWFLIL